MPAPSLASQQYTTTTTRDKVQTDRERKIEIVWEGQTERDSGQDRQIESLRITDRDQDSLGRLVERTDRESESVSERESE